MHDKYFVDSNVLLYAYSIDSKIKQTIARGILLSNNKNVISTQVVNECVNVLLKKYKATNNQIESFITDVQNNFFISTIQIQTTMIAVEVKQKYQLSFYDSLIIAAALQNNCNKLYSEDLHNQLVINNKLTIINPFEK